jgi:hypothetical protein
LALTLILPTIPPTSVVVRHPGGQQPYDCITITAKVKGQPCDHQQKSLQHFHATFDRDLQTLFYAPSSVLHPDLQTNKN